MKTLTQQVSHAVGRLNALYGSGDVIKCGYYADGRIEFTTCSYGMRPQTRHGRLVGNTVHALRRQTKLEDMTA